MIASESGIRYFDRSVPGTCSQFDHAISLVTCAVSAGSMIGDIVDPYRHYIFVGTEKTDDKFEFADDLGDPGGGRSQFRRQLLPKSCSRLCQSPS